jgi:hypothetical protein
VSVSGSFGATCFPVPYVSQTLANGIDPHVTPLIDHFRFCGNQMSFHELSPFGVGAIGFRLRIILESSQGVSCTVCTGKFLRIYQGSSHHI